MNEAVRINNIKDGYIRLVVTRGAGTLGLDPNKCSNPQVIIIADAIALYPPELYEKGLEIVTVSVMRNHPAALNPRIKSLNYLNNILAKIEGLQAGCIEALMLNHKGEVAECTGDNIFLVREGVLYTPPIDAGILEGVTRQAVIDLAHAANIEVREVPLTKHDVYIADECFPDRHRGRSHSGRESRQPQDRHRQARADHRDPEVRENPPGAPPPFSPGPPPRPPPTPPPPFTLIGAAKHPFFERTRKEVRAARLVFSPPPTFSHFWGTFLRFPIYLKPGPRGRPRPHPH